jgi:hypothetical protein
MYFYSIGYTDWEDCPHVTLTHTTLFTQDEFNQILLDAYVNVSKVEEIAHKKWLDTLTNRNLRKDYHIYKPKVDNLYSGVVKLLKSNYGFKDIAIDAHFMPSNISIMDENVPIEESYENKLLRERFCKIEVRDSKITNLLDLD